MHSQTDRFSMPRAEAPAPGLHPSLTYEPFFGLREKAFSLSADPRFLYRSPAHAPAFDDLLAGIRRREGLIVLTGAIGTGKTTLCRSVLQQLDRRTFAAFVADPFVSREDLLKTLLVQFGVISMADLTAGRFNGASRSDLSYPLYEFLDSLVPLQAFAVVVIDEAQNLSLPLLEEIRILSELERREKLLQVVLVGQPELRDSLKLPQMRQVDQRVSVRCELSAIDADCIAGYVEHRLRVAAGGSARVQFTRPAIQAIYRGSAGVPRLINRICDRAFQRAFATRHLLIEAPLVVAAIADLGLEVPTDIEELAPQDHRPEVGWRPIRMARVTQFTQRPEAACETAAPETSAPQEAVVEEMAVPPTLTMEEPEAPRADAPRNTDGESQTVAPDPALTIEDAIAAAANARTITPRIWAFAAIASLVAGAAFLGAPVWYFGASSRDGAVAEMPAVPSAPARSMPPAAAAPPEVTDVAASPTSQTSAPARTDIGAASAQPAAPAATGRYRIMVAAFQSTDRADRVVDELTSAGYGAHAVVIDGGASRGRFVQVMVSGYTSASDVQRDLERIRELPGGYLDARIVEQR